MKPTLHPMSPSRRAVIAALVFASCARSPQSSLQSNAVTNPSAVSAPGGDGVVTGSAAGDVRSGPGVLEINAVRMDRQVSAGGASIFRQYANPGETYPINVGEVIELWVEWDRNIGTVPSGQIPNNPRLVVDWGDGASDNISCGACKLYHKYTRPALFPVKVKLDDRAGTTVVRSFFLDASVGSSGFFALTIACTGEGCSNPYIGGTPKGGGITGPGIACGPLGGSCGPVSFPAGTVVTLTASLDGGIMKVADGGPAPEGIAVSSPTPTPTPTPSPSPSPSCGETKIQYWRGACSGIGTGSGRDFGTCTLTMNANAVVSVQIGATSCSDPGE